MKFEDFRDYYFMQEMILINFVLNLQKKTILFSLKTRNFSLNKNHFVE